MAAEVIWKSVKKKIEGKTKPFVDSNLQIQIPELEHTLTSDSDSAKASLYSHYNQTKEMTDDLSHLEFELNKAIEEAKQTHDAWKKMQNKLLKLAEDIKD